MLKGQNGYTRQWNKRKDTFEIQEYNQAAKWRYCIEGTTLDGDKIRVIITFDLDLMPIITVINLNERQT